MQNQSTLCFLVFLFGLCYNVDTKSNRGDDAMKETAGLSKQQLKSQETRERIFEAAKIILNRDGYEKLSIKNICKEAGVSNGSFYHHFQTKDELLSYYIIDQSNIEPELLDLPKSNQEAKEAILGVYLNYVQNCIELGVEFVAGYYSPQNQALDPTRRADRPYPIVTVQKYLEKAVAANAITMNLSVDEVVTDIRMLVIGNSFEWAMRRGEVDFSENMQRSISHYLDGVMM